MSRADGSDRLLKELLVLAQRRGDCAPEPHPDEETLALLALGELSEEERDSTVAHVADCDLCRQSVAAVLRAEPLRHAETAAPPPAVASRSAASKPAIMYWAIAVAAGLLLLVSATALMSPLLRGRRDSDVYAQALAHLEAGRYDAARGVLKERLAENPGSARLASLLAQAERRIPAALALAHAGRLSDFGVEIGGIVARDPAQWPHREGMAAADAALQDAGNEELEVLLNRGHLLLSRGDVENAGKQFSAAQKLDGDHPLMWLGLGLVAFLEDDLPAAEAAFRRSLELSPDNTAARINLAMTLQEQGKSSEAIDAWRQVLRQPSVSASERARIEQELEALQETL